MSNPELDSLAADALGLAAMSAELGTPTICPLCGSHEARTVPAVINMGCPVCGLFGMTFELSVDRDMQGHPLHPYLSAATRKASQRMKQPIVLDMNNWREIEEAQRSVGVSERLTDLLRFLAEGCGGPGEEYRIRPDRDYPLIGATTQAELSEYLVYLEDRGFVRNNGKSLEGVDYSLTVPGWQEIEPMAPPGGIPGRCFIAMWFDLSVNDALEIGIKPAIRDCGFDPICLNGVPGNDCITDRILSEIRRAQFVVADFTGDRGGVYFEAGFARGLGREVIWTCRKDHLDRVHFDIRHFGYVVWETPKELRENLAESIRANIIPKR